MAKKRGIPIIDQYDYIINQGHAVEDAHCHMTLIGTRRAASGPRKHCLSI